MTMKKAICILVVLLMMASLTACSSVENEQITPATKAPSDSVSAIPTLSSDTPTHTPDEDTEYAVDGHVSDESLDLTALSSTMVYAEVYNMMCTPEDYIGRTVVMSGQFSVYAATETGPYYYACVIADATACCQQGIEFVLSNENLSYPNDYPELGSNITVTGEFQIYMEGEDMYCHLVDAVLDLT